jgi:hypothetical protein
MGTLCGWSWVHDSKKEYHLLHAWYLKWVLFPLLRRFGPIVRQCALLFFPDDLTIASSSSVPFRPSAPSAAPSTHPRAHVPTHLLHPCTCCTPCPTYTQTKSRKQCLVSDKGVVLARCGGGNLTYRGSVHVCMGGCGCAPSNSEIRQNSLKSWCLESHTHVVGQQHQLDANEVKTSTCSSIRWALDLREEKNSLYLKREKKPGRRWTHGAWFLNSH